MRRRDKLKNIERANLLAEQRYLQSKGLLKEGRDLGLMGCNDCGEKWGVGSTKNDDLCPYCRSHNVKGLDEGTVKGGSLKESGGRNSFLRNDLPIDAIKNNLKNLDSSNSNLPDAYYVFGHEGLIDSVSEKYILAHLPQEYHDTYKQYARGQQVTGGSINSFDENGNVKSMDIAGRKTVTLIKPMDIIGHLSQMGDWNSISGAMEAIGMEKPNNIDFTAPDNTATFNKMRKKERGSDYGDEEFIDTDSDDIYTRKTRYSNLGSDFNQVGDFKQK